MDDVFGLVGAATGNVWEAQSNSTGKRPAFEPLFGSGSKLAASKREREKGRMKTWKSLSRGML